MLLLFPPKRVQYLTTLNYFIKILYNEINFKYLINLWSNSFGKIYIRSYSVLTMSHHEWFLEPHDTHKLLHHNQWVLFYRSTFILWISCVIIRTHRCPWNASLTTFVNVLKRKWSLILERERERKRTCTSHVRDGGVYAGSGHRRGDISTVVVVTRFGNWQSFPILELHFFRWCFQNIWKFWICVTVFVCLSLTLSLGLAGRELERWKEEEEEGD